MSPEVLADTEKVGVFRTLEIHAKDHSPGALAMIDLKVSQRTRLATRILKVGPDLA
jgi:hypothetical protein